MMIVKAVSGITLAMVVYGGVSVRLRMTPATSNDVEGRTGTMMVNTWWTVCKGTGTAGVTAGDNGGDGGSSLGLYLLREEYFRERWFMLNRNTPVWVLAGTKNSRPVGFLQ
jgi:hypothetical protein